MFFVVWPLCSFEHIQYHWCNFVYRLCRFAQNITFILQQLKEKENNVLLHETNKINKYITPHALNDNIDEDSADEDNGGSFDNLNSHQLSTKTTVIR